MIVVGKTIVSDEVKEKQFVCDLERCKGACCVEGDLGAPLLPEELSIIEAAYDKIKPYLTGAGIQAIEDQGFYVLDYEGDYSTPTIDGRECAYAVYDNRGILKCGIEQAHRDGKIDFIKPISCHLYPIRTSQYEEFEAINYDRWEICSAACTLGEALKIPVYKFLKEPLIRKYGADWYAALVDQIELENNNKKSLE